MPRTKDFEPQEALDAAMYLFWRKGYEAASMRELLDAMSIGRGSFYDTFGDKHASSWPPSTASGRCEHRG